MALIVLLGGLLGVISQIANQFFASPVLATRVDSDPFTFNPDCLHAPALHDETPVPASLAAVIDLYVTRRDQMAAHLNVMPPDHHREALARSGIIFEPGWGGFPPHRENVARYAGETAGFGYTFLSVAKGGKVERDGSVTTIGSPGVTLAAEWLREFPTVVYRYWYALQIHGYKHGEMPDKNIHIGHSKGGLINYLFACLREAYRKDKAAGNGHHDRLNALVDNLRDELGRAVLSVIPRAHLIEVAAALDHDVIGAIGSPLYGIHGGFERFADFGGRFSFNGLMENSAVYFSLPYLERIFKMTGYRPAKVLDFVVTSRLKPLRDKDESSASLLWRGAISAASLMRSPIVHSANMLFDGAGRVIEPNSPHDGTAPSEYPKEEIFKHHYELSAPATHIDQANQTWVMREIIDNLICDGLVG